MAIFRLDLSHVRRATGRSAVRAAAYQSGARLRDHRTGTTVNYNRRSEVAHTEIFLPPGAAPAMRDREALWNAAEAAEKRHDARVALNIVLALPHELKRPQQLRLLRAFVHDQFVQKHGVAADLAIHVPHEKGADTRNVHAHVLLSQRRLEPDGFSARKQEAMWSRASLIGYRKSWAEYTNQVLEEAGLDIQIDHRSNKDRGIPYIPTIHEGLAARAMEKRGIRADRVALNREIQKVNQEIRGLHLQQLEMKRELVAQRWGNSLPMVLDRLVLRRACEPAPPATPSPAATKDDLECGRVVPEPKIGTEAPRKRRPLLEELDEWQLDELLFDPQSTQLAPGPPGGQGVDRDEIKSAVVTQLKAMGVTKYVVMLMDPRTGQRQEAEGSSTAILNNLDKLIKANVQHRLNVYIRPAPEPPQEHRLILLDQLLCELAIDDIKAAGLTPALVVECGSGNLQTWLKVPNDVTPRECGKIARLVATRYHGAEGSSGDNFGRLAGFIDHWSSVSESRLEIGLLEATGESAPGVGSWVDWVREDPDARWLDPDDLEGEFWREAMRPTPPDILPDADTSAGPSASP